MSVRILIHNVGTSDMAAEPNILMDGDNGIIPGKRGPLIEALSAAIEADSVTATNGLSRDPLSGIQFEYPQGSGVTLTFPRLQAYLAKVLLDDDGSRRTDEFHVILNVTIPMSGATKDAATEWMSPFLMEWLLRCCGLDENHVTLVEFDPSYYFSLNNVPGTVRPTYIEIRTDLEEYRTKWTPDTDNEVDWFVSLTGGLPEMRFDLALAAADVLGNRLTLLKTALGDSGVPRVRPSHVIQVLQLAQVTHLAEQFNYAAAADLAEGILGSEEPPVQLLRYGAARLDLDFKRAMRHRTCAHTCDTIKTVMNGMEVSDQLKLSQIEGDPNAKNRLLEQIYVIEVLFRHQRYRDFVAQLHVFATWLCISYAKEQGGLEFSPKGSLIHSMACIRDLCTYRTTWQDVGSRPGNPLSASMTFLQRESCGSLAAAAWLCESLEKKRRMPTIEREIRALAKIATNNNRRNTAAHSLNTVSIQSIQNTLNTYHASTNPRESIGRLIRNGYRTVFTTVLPELEEVMSPYGTLNRAWRAWVQQYIVETGGL